MLYFLVDLVVLTALAAGVRASCGREKTAGVSIMVIAVGGSCVAFLALQWFAAPVPLWSLANFVAYVPLAWLLSRERLGNPLAVLALFAAVVTSDVLFVMSGRGFAGLSAYARPCLPIGVVLAFWVFRRSPETTWTAWLGPVGRYSLGVFVVHPFYWWLFSKYLPVVGATTTQGGSRWACPSRSQRSHVPSPQSQSCAARS